MQRTMGAFAAADLPEPEEGPSEPGYFRKGNPLTAQKATRLTPEWMNGVQEEIMAVIEEAELEGDIEDNTQLLQAIQALIAAAAPTVTHPFDLTIACSDEVTPLEAGVKKVTFRMPCAVTLSAGHSGIKASLTTAQATSGGGGIITIDVNEGGASILSTKLTIDNTEKTSLSAAAAPVISDVNLAADAEITIDLDQIGDGTATGLKVTFMGVRA